MQVLGGIIWLGFGLDFVVCVVFARFCREEFFAGGPKEERKVGWI